MFPAAGVQGCGGEGVCVCMCLCVCRCLFGKMLFFVEHTLPSSCHYCTLDQSTPSYPSSSPPLTRVTLSWDPSPPALLLAYSCSSTSLLLLCSCPTTRPRLPLVYDSRILLAYTTRVYYPRILLACTTRVYTSSTTQGPPQEVQRDRPFAAPVPRRMHYRDRHRAS